MRDKNFDVDLLKTLNDQPMPETPLTDDEFTRVLDAACGRQPGLSWLRKRDFSAVPAPLKDDRLRQEAISASKVSTSFSRIIVRAIWAQA